MDHRATGHPLNILDFGLLDATNASRGWGGGNPEPMVVGATATSRSYMLGAMHSGRWAVVVGKAQLAGLPCAFNVTVTLRPAATLPPQPQRTPYRPAAPLELARRWYAGDFHVHSRESGDAYLSASLDEIATFGRASGLDFVHISDHNTVSQVSA